MPARCVVREDAQVKGGELYAAYADWARTTGQSLMSSTTFGRRMGKRYGKKKINGTAIYTGIGLALAQQ